MKKIFISHSKKDKVFAKKIVDLLVRILGENVGILCTSLKGYGIPLGEDFLEAIKKWLNEDTIVIFLLTKNYYSSTISICEMGASWITAKKIYPILIPPMTYEDFKGVFPQSLAFHINDKYDLTSFKNQIREEFEVKTYLEDTRWEIFRDDLIEELSNLIDSEKSLTIEEKVLDEQILDIKTSVSQKTEKENLEFVKIPPGNYRRILDKREISLTQELYVSKYLITQSFYIAITGNNPSNNKGEKYPVENVTFFEATTFCNKLSKKRGLKEVYTHHKHGRITIDESVKGYRLPFEYEWEFALKYSEEDVNSNLKKNAWFSENSGGEIKNVGTRAPNEFGIYDMLGNVWEWCNDSFKSSNYITKSGSYKIFDIESRSKVLRGGSFVDFKSEFVKGFRKKCLQQEANQYSGFRIVLQNN
jgi:formylglycine-generating enzyme required for sulfatase activity